jgi:hypothetical protein
MKITHCVTRLREATAIHTRRIARLVAGTSLSLFLCISASAQSGGMGGMGGGTMGAGGMGGGTMMGAGSMGSSSGPGGAKAIGIGVGAVAAGVGVIYLARHHRGPVSGCVTASDDRLTIFDERTGETYILRVGDDDIRAGERVKLKGKRLKDERGALSFDVKKVTDLGSCR